MREPAVQEAVQAAKQVPPQPDILRMRRMQPFAPPPAPVEVQASGPAWKARRGGGGRPPRVHGRRQPPAAVAFHRPSRRQAGHRRGGGACQASGEDRGGGPSRMRRPGHRARPPKYPDDSDLSEKLTAADPVGDSRRDNCGKIAFSPPN